MSFPPLKETGFKQISGHQHSSRAAAISAGAQSLVSPGSSSPSFFPVLSFAGEDGSTIGGDSWSCHPRKPCCVPTPDTCPEFNLFSFWITRFFPPGLYKQRIFVKKCYKLAFPRCSFSQRKSAELTSLVYPILEDTDKESQII